MASTVTIKLYVTDHGNTTQKINLHLKGKRNKQTIGIVICYLGEWPWYFDYFLHSCKFNSSIDFLIITDQEYGNLIPPNVRFYRKTISEINEIFSTKLGFPVNISSGYKLCDFKPAFGLLFSDLLYGYDFWGQSDIDVIYGDIRKFVTNKILDEFDFINVRHDYATGCFYLLRNNPITNNIFRKSKDYIKVLSDNKHYCFDECNFAHYLLRGGRSILQIQTEIESFTHVIQGAVNRKEIKAYFDFILIEGTPGRIKFDSGRIIYKNRFEAILYHLIGLKRICRPKRPSERIPNIYHISSTRIYFQKTEHR